MCEYGHWDIPVWYDEPVYHFIFCVLIFVLSVVTTFIIRMIKNNKPGTP